MKVAGVPVANQPRSVCSHLYTSETAKECPSEEQNDAVIKRELLVIPADRLPGYTVTVTTQLSPAAAEGWRTPAGAAAQAKAVGQQQGTRSHLQSHTQFSRGFFLQKKGSGY